MYRTAFLILIIAVFLACTESAKDKEKLLPQSANPVQRRDTMKRPEGALLWTRANAPETIKLPADVISYITPNHIVLDTATGDADNDGIIDYLLITRINNETDYRHAPKPVKRDMLLFLGSDNGLYHLAFRTKNAIPPINGGGQTDPFGGISIKDGVISITEYISSSCKSITQYNFRFVNVKRNWTFDNSIRESFCYDYRDYTRDTIATKGRERVTITEFDISAEGD